MAGGIDWFRWHHGSVTDPKFQLVARRSKQSLPAVIAVWAYVLERASSADERGVFGDLDFESIDCLMGLDDGATADIIDAMVARGLLSDGEVCAWGKRQPAREREDSGSTERSRKFRHKNRDGNQEAEQEDCNAMQRHATPRNTNSGIATPCNAMQHQKKPRGEESREEEISNLTVLVGRADQPQPSEQPSDPGQEPEPWDAEPGEATEAPAQHLTLLASKTLAEPARTSSASGIPPCPLDEIIDLYHEELPTMPAVRLRDSEKRRRLAQAFWRWMLTSRRTDGQRRATDRASGLQKVRSYFQLAAKNDWLMGRSARAEGHQNWTCDFDFLLTEKGRKHVIELTREAA